MTHPGVGTGKQQKESLTGEQEICVLSVATVMDLGYPVAIYSHVAPKSSTKQQPVRELCLLRGPCWIKALLTRFKIGVKHRRTAGGKIQG